MGEPAFLPTVLRGLRPGHPAPSRQTDASSAETIPERWRWAPGGDLGAPAPGTRPLSLQVMDAEQPQWWSCHPRITRCG